MRRLMLSFLFCLGVGFAMMGSPAQVNDHNAGGSRSGATVHGVTGRAAVHRGRGYIKHETQVKKNVDVTKMNAGRKMMPGFIPPFANLEDLLLINSSGKTGTKGPKPGGGIIKDPVPSLPPAHTNGLTPGSGKVSVEFTKPGLSRD